MQTQLLHEDEGQRTFALIFETGDELLKNVQDFARRESVTAAQFSAIGAFSDVVLAYFDWKTKQYQRRKVAEQVEVASLTGDVALGPDGKPAIHIHAVLGRHDLSALAGHLVEAHVRPTLELVVTEQPAHLCKRHDPESGLTLIRVPPAERR
ncbi:MAG: DNA-binding protein [Alphaproteobacteria bacterium]|nr:DNA-binding protein [Alphaproteobacteria bacterium]MCW5743885.1 DNA-binding protein [Alphaproteobacteria bacterium]